MNPKRRILFIIYSKVNIMHTIRNSRIEVTIMTINFDRWDIFCGTRFDTIFCDKELISRNKKFVEDYIKPCCCIGNQKFCII